MQRSPRELTSRRGLRALRVLGLATCVVGLLLLVPAVDLGAPRRGQVLGGVLRVLFVPVGDVGEPVLLWWSRLLLASGLVLLATSELLRRRRNRGVTGSATAVTHPFGPRVMGRPVVDRQPLNAVEPTGVAHAPRFLDRSRGDSLQRNPPPPRTTPAIQLGTCTWRVVKRRSGPAAGSECQTSAVGPDIDAMMRRVVLSVFDDDIDVAFDAQPGAPHVRRVHLAAGAAAERRTAGLRAASTGFFEITIFDLGVSATLHEYDDETFMEAVLHELALVASAYLMGSGHIERKCGPFGARPNLVLTVNGKRWELGHRNSRVHYPEDNLDW